MNALTIENVLGLPLTHAFARSAAVRENAQQIYQETLRQCSAFEDELTRYALAAGRKQLRTEVFAVDETSQCRPCAGTGKDRGSNIFYDDTCLSCMGTGHKTVLASKEVTI